MSFKITTSGLRTFQIALTGGAIGDVVGMFVGMVLIDNLIGGILCVIGGTLVGVVAGYGIAKATQKKP